MNSLSLLDSHFSGKPTCRELIGNSATLLYWCLKTKSYVEPDDEGISAMKKQIENCYSMEFRRSVRVARALVSAAFAAR